MNLREAASYLQSGIAKIYDNAESAAIADLLLEHITGLQKKDRLASHKVSLTDEQMLFLHEVIKRLQHHEPIQYITNTAWFYHQKFYVDQNVLIPRPETEELTHWLISDLQSLYPSLTVRDGAEADATRFLKIIDIGTGSGCIALSIKRALPLAEVWGCDVSTPALNVARRNGALLDVRVDFAALDFLNAREQIQLPNVDVIVSNPPYIPLSERSAIDPHVLQEPATALFVADNDPLIFYKAILSFAQNKLNTNGRIYLETHFSYANQVAAIFDDAGLTTEVRADMQGKTRMVRAILL